MNIMQHILGNNYFVSLLIKLRVVIIIKNIKLKRLTSVRWMDENTVLLLDFYCCVQLQTLTFLLIGNL
ncbi:hypothetical protein T10_229 [Trichinella papuae]|uniref:Uncharacterized protein n=1 Tax=Trichinella papuae TaxID=268474 RepID=A0A0V1M1S3_9BILA|nr:hypothetical protein T10_229 [Trichinella papuae]